MLNPLVPSLSWVWILAPFLVLIVHKLSLTITITVSPIAARVLTMLIGKAVPGWTIHASYISCPD